MTDVLNGGDELGGRLRDLDWAQTPFGAPASWPQSLRSAASICLNSRFPIAIYWGPQLALLYNDAWRPILGEKHPWALGRPGREVWPEIWSEIGPLFEAVQRTGEGVWQQDQLLPMHRHGYTEECYFNFTFSPIRGEDGPVAGIFNAVIETTYRVIEERRARLLRDLSEGIGGVRSAGEACRRAAALLEGGQADLPFCLFYLRDSDSSALRLTAAGGVGLPAHLCPATLDAADEEAPWRAAEALRSGRSVVVDRLGARYGVAPPSGIWPEPLEQAVAAPIAGLQTGEPVGLLIAGVSPRRALDEAYHTFIERAALQVATAIGNADAYEAERRRAEALAAVDAAKTAFFSNVSHEFRTPLTLMLGPLEDLLARGEGLPADDRERLDVAHRNALRLLKLVNTLLDFSRIEAGAGQPEATFEATDLATLTAELASVFRSAIERAGLRLLVDCPPLDTAVYVDRELWEKIVLNLLSNAFKFTFEGEIAVVLRQRGPTVELSVRDTGTGIPAEELPQLFERFHRVRGVRGRTIEGTGIGLALVQELVRLHGGSVRVASELDCGTTFTVTIPTGTRHLPADRIRVARNGPATTLHHMAFVEEALRWLPDDPNPTPGFVAVDAAAEHRLRDATPAADASRRARILLADDNADLRAYLRRLLGQRYDVVTVADGAAALEAARSQPFDLVLADVMMPRLDGFGLLAALRADVATQTLPVILLSARAGEEARLDGLDAGADEYLIKPFSANELLARVRATLNLVRLRRDAEARVRASEQRFRRVVESRPVGVLFADAAGRITDANQALLEMLGYTREGLIGMTWAALTPAAYAARDAEAAAELLASGSVRPYEKAYIHADGSQLPVLVAATLLNSDTGREAVGFVLDHSEVKRTQAQLRAANYRFQLAEEAAQGFSYEWDLETGAVTRSESITRVLGYRPEELGASWQEWSRLIHPDDRIVNNEDEALALARGAPEGTFGREYRVRHRDGHYVWVLERAIIVHDERGRARSLIGQTVDVSSRKELEAERERLYAQERAARELAEEASRLKDEFLATVSHELRTPLTAFLGYAQLLQSRKRDEAYVARTVERMLRSAKAQAQLIEDLLDISRIVSGKLRLEPLPVDLRSVVRAALDTLRPAAEAKVLRVQVSLDPAASHVVGDANRLQQVVWNLLSNAVKFTPTGGSIQVTLERRGRNAQLKVRDSGQGIRADFLPYVFDRFRQADGTTNRAHGGLGLGLSIVRHLVELHGGSVEATSAGEGQGATFRVRLPLMPEDDGAAGDAKLRERGQAEEGCPPELDGLRVLIVDDQPDILELLHDVLALCGASVRLCDNARDALAAVHSWRPDVLVSDIAMPGDDGYWLIAQLRALPAEEGGRLPAIALTAYVRMEDRLRVLAAGFEQYVPKPVEPAELRAVVTRLARSRTPEQ
jgi:PAS domain S-box-containing protein